jgi:uncharacterized oligopeptide transporter (OPT) family protein
MLWIGVMVMLCSSFAEVACNGPILYRGAKRAFFEAAEKIPKTRAFAEKHLVEDGEEIDDPSPKNEQVPTWVWVTGLLTSIAVTMIVLDLQYDVNPGMTILAVILAFIFSFVAAQSAGATDINPVGTVSKASQLIFGGVTQGEGIYGGAAQKINLIAGVVTGGAAAQSVDLLGDLRTGYLLSAAPYTQFIAQGVGSFFAIFLSAGFFVLYTNAYPCILDTELPGTCQFPAPSIASWVAVANAVTSKNFPVPHNSAIVALILGIFSAIVVLVRYLWSKSQHFFTRSCNN